MYIEHCVESDYLSLDNTIEGEAVKAVVLSFLGDVDKNTGLITSIDSGCSGCGISKKILVVERFRGSTVGTYILYSLCKKGLGPRAILSIEPDPVVVAGAALCGIPMIYELPSNFVQSINTGDKVKIEQRGKQVCIVVKKEY